MIWGTILSAAIAAVLVAIIATMISNLSGITHDSEPEGLSGGHAAEIIRALFLMVFAIGLVVPWTTNDSARQNTYAEAQSLVEAYWQAGGLPAPDRGVVRGDLQHYTRFVVNQEWPVLASGHLDQQGWTILDDLRKNLMSQNYQQKSYSDAENSVVSELSDVYAARRQRAVDAAASLPEAVIVFAIITGILVVFFPFLVGVRPRGRAMVPMLVTAALVGAGLFLVMDNNHTFSGGIAVGPEAFRAALTEMQRISS